MIKRGSICESGHCTCFVDQIGTRDHSSCCKLHDFNYGKQKVTRKIADHRFLKCMKKRSYYLVSYGAFTAVRLFGWYRWNQSNKGGKMAKKVSNAILDHSELMEHFGDELNHYLYKKEGSCLFCSMCCDFEILKDGDIKRGERGESIVYDLSNKTISIERK